MTRTPWRDRPRVVERPDRWGSYAVLSIGVGTLVSGAIPVSVVAFDGGFVNAPILPTLMVSLLGFVVSGVSSTLVVLTAIGFARIAERASTVSGRAAIMTGGVAGGVGLAIIPLFVAVDGPGPAIGATAAVIVGTALALAGGALAPWRYGFARPNRTTPPDEPGVP